MTEPRSVVIISFGDAKAHWDAKAEAWVHLPDTLSAWDGSTPNIEEWISFWAAPAKGAVEIDHRDLAFDGRTVKEPDWVFRKTRWLKERGDNPPPPAAMTDLGYSAKVDDEGWSLIDTILGVVVMRVSRSRD